MFESVSLPVHQIGFVVSATVVATIAWRLVDLPEAVGSRLRGRFLVGVPWGTVLTVALVGTVYLTAQGGLDHWGDPLVIPYRAWSYQYPLGILASGLSHASSGHLLGNLIATLTFAPIAEFAWGHFPPGRGRSAFGRWRDRPTVRIAAVPVVALIGAVLTAAFAWGPVIGFSGVVFAFAGVAVLRHPLATLVAIVLGTGVRLAYTALVEPIAFATPAVTSSTPWWAGVAVQGHLFGFGLGVLAGLVLAWRRDWTLSAAWIWAGTLGFALEQSLWAVFWAGDGGYYLFRAAGAVGILALATVVTAAATGRGAIFDDPIGRALDGTPLDRLDWGIPTRGTAITVLVGVLAVTGAVAVTVNLQTVDDPGPDRAVEIADYRVGYDEDRETRQVSVFDGVVPNESLSWNFEASGVIVTSQERSIWTVAVPTGRLERSNNANVVIGGPDWRRTIDVRRRGWAVPDNGTVYAVDLHPDGGERHRVYESTATTANLSVAAREVTIEPTGGRFALVVDGPNGSSRGRVPWPGERTTVGGLTIHHTDGALYASHAETRVRIASRIGATLDTDDHVVTLGVDQSVHAIR
ncbi:rhomboid family intramembrane serine protease [Halococcoides cellulosivorans]|uniref:Rhomboid family intramembrane serine protease n=1 Tax=Halococcoides cellulosivorans TaxID=1679096 RepID=A0A2R4X1G2_9EURY|nr:rhomboid family intramembrane serine protease [Halococcoides cellulosivorans]AWB27632.1 rhomboid family intramembrane serine protease [Halococcoides cellulosivorans]